MYNSIKRNTLKGTLLACASLFGVFFTSCQNSDNDIWDKDPIVRLEEKKTEIRNALVSSPNGWIVTFSPDGNKYLGGFNMWMKFSEGSKVSIKSDLYLNQLEAHETEFDFTLLNSVALNFPFGTKVHEFTSLSPTDLRTDIEFIFSAFVDENTIEFVGQMTGQKVYFKRATAEQGNFNFQSQWNTFTLLKTLKVVNIIDSGASTNFTYSPLLGDNDWRSAQMVSGSTTIAFLTFTSSEDGSILTLGTPYMLKDGSSISQLERSGNLFTGVSSTGGTMIIR